jgi:predicted PurR-regulated permease PerM
MRITIPASKSAVLTMFQYMVFGSVVLYFGRTLFIPLAFAVLISFVLYPVCLWLERKGLRKIPSILMSITLIILLLIAALALMVYQFSVFLQEWPVIQVKLTEAMNDLSTYFAESLALSKTQQKIWVTHIGTSSLARIPEMLRQFLLASAANLVLLVIIPVFAALILYYRHILVEGLFKLFPKQNKFRIQNILLLTIKSYYNFIKGMLVVYVIVGILNSVGLLIIGVPHAIFFGFVAAILTFIPYIGIVVGALLPMAMAWITFNSIWYAAGVMLIFAFVQYLEANIIFPLAVSNRLNVNALATLITIIAGGIVWGVSGMILFVPFLAILKLIADNYPHPHLKAISVLIGTGN